MKPYKILAFIASAILILAVVCACFPKKGVEVGDHTLNFPSLKKVMNPEKELDVERYLAEQDSLKGVLQSKQDTLAQYRQRMDSSDTRFWFPDDDDRFFDPLFARMEAAQDNDRVIRVVHYGDSQIEMDRISDRLRARLQALFGGGGPGMVPFATLIPSLSVSTYGTGDLTRQSPFGDSLVVRANGNYGPMVQDFRVAGSATANINATTHKRCDERLRQFSRIKMLFNNRPGPLNVTFRDRKGGYSDEQRCDTPGVQSLSWRLDSATTSVRISVSGTADIYGILVDDGPGVAVDNIPMRGCSGQQFTSINQEQLAAAYSQMDVGLIILQFGGNSVPYIKNAKSLDTYCANLGKQIDRLHQCCPNAKILFIGPSDMSTRLQGDMQSYPFLPDIIEGLRQMANDHGAAYWSIYHAMGGYNSMPAWVRQGLGGPDYLHFSQRGADIMGDRLAGAFERMYEIYLMRKEVAHAE